MLILATSDVHSPEYLQLYLESLKKINSNPEIVFFAGDMVDKNKVFLFQPIYEATRKKFPSAKIIAIFGNDEYRGYEKLYEHLYKDVIWLNDNYILLDNNEIGIIGTRGALEKPTKWQAQNIPGIEKYYKELPFKIEKLAFELREKKCKKVILVSHYGVTRSNLRGEEEAHYPYLVSTLFERIIRRELFDLVIHGHVHLGQVDVVHIRGVPVYNVSLPARKRIVEIEI